MELIKTLANLKIKSYYLTALFLFSLSVPGVLILIHFYPKLFMSLDTLRLVMIIITVGVGVLVFSYVIASIALFAFAFKYRNDDAFEDENEYIEVVFIWSSQISLLIIFFWFLVFHFLQCRCLGWYMTFVVISNVILSVILYFSLNVLLTEVSQNHQKAVEEEQKDKLLKVKQLTEKLYRIEKQIQFYQKRKQEVSNFKLFRTGSERNRQIAEVDEKLNKLIAEHKTIESTVNEMIANK